ncbi:acyltransferase [Sphingobium sp. H39-3-25]|uniref:acyltransferase family protein n=1 Tax=Sphingobium arseniciresistens TaxID=3030834 RepID=UPI0023B9949F|nr:acyltransferase [Sphingobium arseniciresistens]
MRVWQEQYDPARRALNANSQAVAPPAGGTYLVTADRPAQRRDAATGARSRDQSIETLRIIATFGTVAYHAGAPFHEFAYSSLIIFLALSPMVDTRFNWGRSRSVEALALALLLPWAFWTLLYGAVNLLLHRPLFPEGSGATAILYGTSQHLWFLPFMFAVLLILNVLKRHIRPPVLFWFCTIATTALLATVSWWRPVSFTFPLPFPQWIHAAPAVFAGGALGLAGKMSRGSRLVAMMLVMLGLTVAMAAWLPDIGIPYACGIVMIALVTRFGARGLPPAWHVQPLASCMMGVYLSHMILLRVFGAITGHGNYVTVTLAFVTGSLGVWMARRFLPASKLILG